MVGARLERAGPAGLPLHRGGPMDEWTVQRMTGGALQTDWRRSHDTSPDPGGLPWPETASSGGTTIFSGVSRPTWPLPKLTMGKPMIMGRKTFQSIGSLCRAGDDRFDPGSRFCCRRRACGSHMGGGGRHGAELAAAMGADAVAVAGGARSMPRPCRTFGQFSSPRLMPHRKEMPSFRLSTGHSFARSGAWITRRDRMTSIRLPLLTLKGALDLRLG
jgi:hypothetical protein